MPALPGFLGMRASARSVARPYKRVEPHASRAPAEPRRRLTLSCIAPRLLEPEPPPPAAARFRPAGGSQHCHVLRDTELCLESIFLMPKVPRSAAMARGPSCGPLSTVVHHACESGRLLLPLPVVSMSLNSPSSLLPHVPPNRSPSCAGCWLLMDKTHINLRSASVWTYTFSPRGFPLFLSICGTRGLHAFNLALLLTYPNPNL
jgi:hypothetical protein